MITQKYAFATSAWFPSTRSFPMSTLFKNVFHRVVVKGLISSNTSGQWAEHVIFDEFSEEFFFSPRHPWFHPAKRVFVPRDTQIAVPKIDKTETLISQYTQFRFLFTLSDQLWEWRILAACVNRTCDLIGYISHLKISNLYRNILTIFMKFLYNIPILSLGRHKNTFWKYNTYFTGCPRMFYTVFQKNIKNIKSTMSLIIILVIECLIYALTTVKISFTYLYPLRCDMVSLKIDE